MPSPYAGVNNYPTNYNIPSDGDDDAALTFNPAFEALGDRTTFLFNRRGWDEFSRNIVLDSGGDGNFTSYQSSSSLTLAAVTGSGLSFSRPTSTGDLVEGFSTTTFLNTGGAAGITLEWQINENGIGYTRAAASRCRFDSATGEYITVTVPLLYVIGANPGTFNARLYMASRTGGNSVALVGSLSEFMIRTGRAS